MLGLFVSRCFLRLTISAIDNGELHQLAPFIVVVSRRQKMAYALDTLSQFLLAPEKSFEAWEFLGGMKVAYR